MKITTIHRTLLNRAEISAQFTRALGGSWLNRAWLFLRVITLPRNGRKPRRATCFWRGRRFHVHLFAFRELRPFLEVFAAGEYRGEWAQCKTIVDVGANIGAASLYFWLHAPDARIIAIEPNTANLERLRLNLAQVPGAVILPKALAGQRGCIDADGEAPGIHRRFSRRRDAG
jgi:hypothetical protein